MKLVDPHSLKYTFLPGQLCAQLFCLLFDWLRPVHIISRVVVLSHSVWLVSGSHAARVLLLTLHCTLVAQPPARFYYILAEGEGSKEESKGDLVRVVQKGGNSHYLPQREGQFLARQAEQKGD